MSYVRNMYKSTCPLLFLFTIATVLEVQCIERINISWTEIDNNPLENGPDNSIGIGQHKDTIVLIGMCIIF